MTSFTIRSVVMAIGKHRDEYGQLQHLLKGQHFSSFFFSFTNKLVYTEGIGVVVVGKIDQLVSRNNDQYFPSGVELV